MYRVIEQNYLGEIERNRNPLFFWEIQKKKNADKFAAPPHFFGSAQYEKHPFWGPLSFLSGFDSKKVDSKLHMLNFRARSTFARKQEPPPTPVPLAYEDSKSQEIIENEGNKRLFRDVCVMGFP